MKRFVLGFIAALFVVLVAACEAGYEDVAVVRYVMQASGIAVTNAAELAKIGVDEDYPLDGAYYLAADIDLPQGGWTPIGTLDAPFSGVLDGNGKTIRGLLLNDSTTPYNGLFGYILYARLSGFTIEVENAIVIMASGAAQYAGAVVGYAKSSNIFDITVRGAAGGQLHLVNAGGVATANPPNFFGAGGLAGCLEASEVSNITVNLNLKATGGTGTTGIAGLCAGLVAGRSIGTTIASCSVEGTLDAASGLAQVYAGGVAGYTNALIENCVSAVIRISAKTSNGGSVYAGGIAGLNTAAGIVSCRLAAGHPVTIQGTAGIGSASAYAGGIGGNVTNVDKCLVDAEVTIIADATGVASLYAGGIGGQCDNVSNSLVRRGEVLARAPSSTVTTYVAILAGGIAGRLSGGGNNIPVKILNCFSRANVTAESALCATTAGTSSAPNVSAAGGVAGGITSQNNHIEFSGASGTVRAASTNSEINAQTVAFAGGILGFCANTSTYVSSIKKSVAFNNAVTAEAGIITPYAYRVLGGHTTATAGVVAALDAVPNLNTLSLDSNYALADMTVQTRQGSGDLTDVPQEPNNTGNLMGSANITGSLRDFLATLGWDFNNDWDWDDAAELPVPRY
jgi:hypothetical protein